MSTRRSPGKGLQLRAPPRRRRAGARRSCRRRRMNKIRALYEPGSYEVVPHDNMRKIIAQRLVEAKPTIPHFYLTHRLRHRQAPGRARGDQRRRAEGQGRQAGLQDLGQRFRHQGAGDGAAARARRQRHLDRGRHAQAQALRRRRRGLHSRRADHAGRAPCRHQIALGDLQRDEGFRRARAGEKAQAGRISGRHHARSRTSACSA